MIRWLGVAGAVLLACAALWVLIARMPVPAPRPLTEAGGAPPVDHIDDRSREALREILRSEIEKHFRPEFLNRLDEVIFFKSLTRDDLVEIVDIEVGRVKERLAQRGITLELTPDAKGFIIDKGYEPDFGARPLRRAVENLIEDPLSEEILRGSLEGKGRIVVRLRDDHLYFDAEGSEPVEAPAAAGSK